MLLLILANVWKWWPSVGAHLRGQDMPESRLLSAEDFQVHGLTMGHPANSGRDIFHLGNRDSGAQEGLAGLEGQMISTENPSPSRKRPASSRQASAEPFASQELAAGIGQAPNGQIKCIGVLFQKNKEPEAYVVRGEQHYILRPGDVLDGQFVVEKITINAVYFKDRQTGETGLVPVDGKEGSVNE